MSPKEEGMAVVLKGAALLDELLPGKLAGIDPNKVNLNSPNFCPVAFLYGSWEKGRTALGLNQQELIEHGFIDSIPGGVTGEAWRILIASRKGFIYPQ